MRIPVALLVLVLGLAACSSTPDAGPVSLSDDQAKLCQPVKSVSIEGAASHVKPPQRVTYDTNPPVFGPHYGQVARTGVFEESIPNEVMVHNLEHGHVVVSYRDLSDDELKAVRDVVLPDPFMMVMAPKSDMEAKLALAAWGHLVTCDGVASDVATLIRGFVTSYRDKAPESIP